MHKILGIDETIVFQTERETSLFRDYIKMANEAGYTMIHSYWGHNAYDEISMSDMIKNIEAEEQKEQQERTLKLEKWCKEHPDELPIDVDFD